MHECLLLLIGYMKKNFRRSFKFIIGLSHTNNDLKQHFLSVISLETELTPFPNCSIAAARDIIQYKLMKISLFRFKSFDGTIFAYLNHHLLQYVSGNGLILHPNPLPATSNYSQGLQKGYELITYLNKRVLYQLSKWSMQTAVLKCDTFMHYCFWNSSESSDCDLQNTRFVKKGKLFIE